jgi:hypothetical protein
MAAITVPGPYTYTPQSYSTGTPVRDSYTRTIRVTGSLNNPLTLTGSYANNAAFMVMNTASVFMTASNGTGFFGADWHSAGQNHVIYPIQLAYVSCSAGGDVVVLYNV